MGKVRRLRLASGLVLFLFVLTHLANHALGLISLEALEAGRIWFFKTWRNLPATTLLYAALLLHLGLALWAVYRRRRLAMPPWETVQLLVGLAIPPLLVLHILGTRFAYEVFGVDDTYTYVLLAYFVLDPMLGVKQALVVLLAWLHGCIGLHFWLRLKRHYQTWAPLALAAAVLLPTLALLGMWAGGREVLRLAGDPVWVQQAMKDVLFPDAAERAVISRVEDGLLLLLLALLAATLAARRLRSWQERRRGLVRLTYPDGRVVAIAPGTTILEASQSHGIPHASVCGGRGRCSTCRVRVGRGRDVLPQLSEAEARVLTRVAGATTNLRLACQTRPLADLEVTPLLPPGATPRQAWPRPGFLQGEEREIAILFADLRDFTSLAENKLPYDVVFILNRYFAAMGLAVEESGGRIDKFIGDGVMALFGLEDGIADGCRSALAAARRMAERLDEINGALQHDLATPLRIGIGIHSGPVIVGEMGYGRASSVTAIGDAVNTASRLEGMTKSLGAQLIVSEPVARHAGIDLAEAPRRQIELRGREGLLAVRIVADAQNLPEIAAAPGGPSAAAPPRLRRAAADRPGPPGPASPPRPDLGA